MDISVKAQYALEALFDLAIQSPGEPVKIADIAKRQKIPQKFLELILASLKQGGFVQSKRGAEGGYLLARRPGADHRWRRPFLRGKPAGKRRAGQGRPGFAFRSDVGAGGKGGLGNCGPHVARGPCPRMDGAPRRRRAELGYLRREFAEGRTVEKARCAAPPHAAHRRYPGGQSQLTRNSWAMVIQTGKTFPGFAKIFSLAAPNIRRST